MNTPSNFSSLTLTDLVCLDKSLIVIIYQALNQYKEHINDFFPPEVINQYKQELLETNDEYLSSDFINSCLLPQEIETFFTDVFNTMLFAFNPNSAEDYIEVELPPIEFDLHTFSVIPKPGYTEEDVYAYQLRYDQFKNTVEAKRLLGMQYFIKYSQYLIN